MKQDADDKDMETMETRSSINDCWNQIGVWRTGEECCPVLDKVRHCHNCDVYSSAGISLLDRDLPDGYLDEWTEIYSRSKVSDENEILSATVFRLGDEWFSIPSYVVLEVAHVRTIHTLPHYNSRSIRGITNVHGELKICFSLGEMLTVNKSVKTYDVRGNNAYERLVVIGKDGHSYAFPVSEIPGTHKYTAEQLTSVPSTVSRAKATYTKGMIPWDNTHIALIDEELLFYALERSLS